MLLYISQTASHHNSSPHGNVFLEILSKCKHLMCKAVKHTHKKTLVFF